jgi:hypothetical protein
MELGKMSVLQAQYDAARAANEREPTPDSNETVLFLETQLLRERERIQFVESKQ